MKLKKLSEKITAKHVVISIILLVVAVVVVFIAINWNIFTDSVSVGWNSR